MTYTVKVRGAVGQAILVEYMCPDHGVIERTVKRDANGDPPAVFYCDVHLCGEACGFDMCCCDQPATLLDSAPKLRNLTVLPIAVVKGGDTDRRPGMLDTRPLAEGQSYAEWRKVQDKARESRRHDMLVSKGLKQKRIQVG